MRGLKYAGSSLLLDIKADGACELSLLAATTGGAMGVTPKLSVSINGATATLLAAKPAVLPPGGQARVFT